ncbi:hypothetical protein DFH08DRAFT_979342 [Mycena albidolilacea]|uniref:F-box domain-containing protein n=1 Tax=Mycena albidolilacea TaxID=1033008 RepID=A0AAD6YX98_9AGAR|nr:hypothetical protein DFH08DRAFT_979342 [Mycena albidolilacea]
MSDIPVELLLAILGWVEDTAVLFNLRLVSKTFNAIAASMVLRVLRVTDVAQSVDGLACIQAGGTDTLNSVQEIVFEAAGDGYGQEGDALDTAFSGLAKFRNLRVLRLRFNSYSLPVQLRLFTVLAAYPPPPLISLTLYDIIPIPDGIYATEAFQNIFRSLTMLCISVSSGNQPQLSDFWESIGVLPAFPVAHIHLPMLAALTLDNFVLHPARADYDIAEFIVRHKATLTHLELTDCWVLRGEQGVYARPWHSLFQLFQQELVGLRSLSKTVSWYSSRLCGYLFFPAPESAHTYDTEAAVQAKDLDNAALESLTSTMELRTPRGI